MKIALLADGRSPITQAWINCLVRYGHTIHLLSSYPCMLPSGAFSLSVIPLAFSDVTATSAGSSGRQVSLIKNLKKKLIQIFRLPLLKLRYTLGPWSVKRNAGKYQKYLRDLNPDLVHALRIPYEGMLAGFTPAGIPLIVSSWGNDFTLHGEGSKLMNSLTRQCLQRADGFMADCERDIRLARENGFAQSKPTLVIPGNGGLDLERMQRLLSEYQPENGATARQLTVINPRGIRPAYVMNESFFKAIPLVLEKFPAVQFMCSSMLGQFDAEKWVREIGLDQSVTLLPTESQNQLWKRFLSSAVLVSPSIHDGTPNSVIEGMALGCFPIVGNIESLREWITDGVNGYLVDPQNPRSIADAIIMALQNNQLREAAAGINQQLIREKAEAGLVARKVNDFYQLFKVN